MSLNLEVAVADAMRTSLIQFGVEVGNLTVQTIAGSRKGFQVTFEKGTAKFVQAKNGQWKAQTRKPNGAFQEIGNIDRFGTWAGRIANLSAVMVSVANIVSNADASKNLSKISNDLDRLFAYRAIDQIVGVKVAYEDLREELGRENLDAEHVHEIRSRIRSVRHTLLSEASFDVYDLALLYPETSGFLARPRKKLNSVVTKMSPTKIKLREEQLRKIRGKVLLASHCLIFEDVAASVTGSSKAQATLRSEAQTLLADMLPKFQRLEAELAISTPISNIISLETW